MKDVLAIVEQSQKELGELLLKFQENGGMTRERYCRFLSMQYHLTNGVQKHFLRVASHEDFAHKKSFRDFLYKFALEEEPHYLIAKQDLKNLGEEPCEVPFDIKLWKAYFDSIIDTKPLMRLGATCVLENISTPNDKIIQSLLTADFLNPRNLKFITIHRHSEELPHGDEIIEALDNASLNERQLSDVKNGAIEGKVMYLRMLNWVFQGHY